MGKRCLAPGKSLCPATDRLVEGLRVNRLGKQLEEFITQFNDSPISSLGYLMPAAQGIAWFYKRHHGWCRFLHHWEETEEYTLDIARDTIWDKRPIRDPGKLIMGYALTEYLNQIEKAVGAKLLAVGQGRYDSVRLSPSPLTVELQERHWNVPVLDSIWLQRHSSWPLKDCPKGLKQAAFEATCSVLLGYEHAYQLAMAEKALADTAFESLELTTQD